MVVLTPPPPCVAVARGCGLSTAVAFLRLASSLALSLAEEIRPEGCESGSIRFSEEKEKDCSSSTLVRPDRRCQIISEADLLLLLHLIE